MTIKQGEKRWLSTPPIYIALLMTRNGKVKEKKVRSKSTHAAICLVACWSSSESPQLAAVASQQLAERSIIGANVYAPMYKEEIRVEVKE